MLYKSTFSNYLCCFLLFCISCGKDRQYIEQSLSVTFDIPAGLNTIESHYFRVNDVYLFLDETLNKNGLPIGASYEIGGSKALLTSRLSGVDYSIIEKISVFVVDKSNSLNRIEMFYNENISSQTLTSLKLLASISDISPYIHDKKIDLEVRIKFRGFMPSQVKADLDFGYIIYKN
jgi:hypothetical protein